MRKLSVAILGLLVALVTVGCGGQSPMASSTTMPASTGTAPVGVTVTDTPPDGVTVLFFQLSVSSATLTSQSGSNVSLMSGPGPIPFNVARLQTELEFLGSKNVAAGNYTGLNLTFATNPQLTIYNGSGAAIGSCANHTVCQLTPSTTPLTLSFTSSPFPLTLSANSPLAFKLDIHLDTVIQSDLTVNLAAANGVTLSQITPPSNGEPIPRLGRLRGTVQTVGTNQFTLQSWDGRTFTINVNSSTTYENFPSSSACSAEGFPCVATGQYLKVLVTLQTDGTLLATDVNYLAPTAQQTVEGTIIGLSTANGDTTMDLILERDPDSSTAGIFHLGNHARVTVPGTGVTYAVDWGDFTPPTGVALSFAGATDLETGQEVQVVVEGSVSTSGGSMSTPFGMADATFTASSISLEPSQITGKVASAPDTSALSFTLSTFPGFFMPVSPTPGTMPSWAPETIAVQTAGGTTFVNFNPDSISGVAVNDVVSVDGWVFSTPSGTTKTTVAADKVLLRPGPTPFF